MVLVTQDILHDNSTYTIKSKYLDIFYIKSSRYKEKIPCDLIAKAQRIKLIASITPELFLLPRLTEFEGCIKKGLIGCHDYMNYYMIDKDTIAIKHWLNILSYRNNKFPNKTELDELKGLYVYTTYKLFLKDSNIIDNSYSYNNVLSQLGDILLGDTDLRTIFTPDLAKTPETILQELYQKGILI